MKVLENPRWFEHYTHERDKDPSLDEVSFIDRGIWTNYGEVKWTPGYYGATPVAEGWQQLTQDVIPDFASTGFENEMIRAVRDRPYIHPAPAYAYVGKCPVCGQMATIDPDVPLQQQRLLIHQNKPCPGYPVGQMLRLGIDEGDAANKLKE